MDSSTINAQARALLDAIRAASNPKPDVIPPGWLSTKEIAKELGVGRDHALTLLEKTPGVEKKTFRVATSNPRHLALVPHFRLAGLVKNK